MEILVHLTAGPLPLSHGPIDGSTVRVDSNGMGPLILGKIKEYIAPNQSLFMSSKVFA